MELQNVVLVDGVRSGFTRGARGAFVATRMDDLAVQVLRTLLERNPKVDIQAIEEIGLGNVTGIDEFAGLGANIQKFLTGDGSQRMSRLISFGTITPDQSRVSLANRCQRFTATMIADVGDIKTIIHLPLA